MKRFFETLTIAAGLAGFSLGMAGAATAQDDVIDDSVGYYYDYYDAGYEGDVGDDWFFDYYEYGAEEAADYDYYGDYDYETDVFDWEEDGLFD